MSIFKINLSATNPKEEHRQTPLIESLVDTGSELSWMPKQALLDIGVQPRGKKRFTTAAGLTVEREFGYTILSAEGYSTIDEVVFAEAGDLTLLGVRTLVTNGQRTLKNNKLLKPLVTNAARIARCERIALVRRGKSHFPRRHGLRATPALD